MTARISIDGNLVADPDFGVGDSGKSWAHLRVASHERMRRDGGWVSTDPEFYNVTLFGAAAETAANELKKGDRISIEGRPQLETFDRRDGTTGAAIKVYARKALKIDDSAGTERSSIERDVTGDSGPDTGGTPRIHHTAETTAVVGVGRTAAALHKTLKDNGFRWSTATTSWNLPTDMDEHTRAARVSELLSTVRANGRDLPVVNDPAPQRAGMARSVTAGAPPAATVTTLHQPAGRSL